MYFECNTNVQNVVMYQEYGRIISRSCVKCCPMQHFHQSQHNRWTSWTVALLQIVVLQQDLLERDVEEARKRKRTRRPRRYQTRPWLAEERRRLYELRQTDGGAQSQRPTVLLQLPQDGACHVWRAGAESGTKDWEANRDVPTAFEPHSSGYQKFRTAFEVHSSWILLIFK